MFNPFALFKKQPSAEDVDPKMIRDFLTQLAKLSPTERAHIKKMMGSYITRKLSPADIDKAFHNVEVKFRNDFTPSELERLKQELKELLA